MIRTIVLGVAASGSLLVGIAGAQETGTVRGRFVVEGALPPPVNVVGDESLVVDDSGGLKNVLIYLPSAMRQAAREKAPGLKPVTVTLKDGKFNPRVAAVQTSQTLELVNADTVNYSPMLRARTNKDSNVLLSSGASHEFWLPRAESHPIRMFDSIKHASGWIFVHDNPHFAISAADGSFVIRDAPAARGVATRFQLWHERSGVLPKMTIELRPGMNELGDIAIAAARLN